MGRPQDGTRTSQLCSQLQIPAEVPNGRLHEGPSAWILTIYVGDLNGVVGSTWLSSQHEDRCRWLGSRTERDLSVCFFVSQINNQINAWRSLDHAYCYFLIEQTSHFHGDRVQDPCGCLYQTLCKYILCFFIHMQIHTYGEI